MEESFRNDQEQRIQDLYFLGYGYKFIFLGQNETNVQLSLTDKELNNTVS